MTPYRRVLCPTDFSDLSKSSLRRAVEWSRKFEAELTVLHVVDAAIVNVGNLVALPEADRELRRAAEKSVENLRAEMDLGGARVIVEEGVPADKIVEATKDSACDLLIMGTHGHSGLSRLLLGSVTEKVLHRTRVPVLTVSESSLETANRPGAIVTAVDFGPETQNVIRRALWLAEHFQAKLFLVHAVPVPYVVLSDRTMSRLTAEQLTSLEDTLTSDRREELRELLPDTPSVPFEVAAKVGSPFDVLRREIDEHQPDLIVMGAGGHGPGAFGWLGSTCHKVVRAAPCSVLVVR